MSAPQKATHRKRRSAPHRFLSQTITNELGRRIEMTVQDAILDGQSAVSIWMKGPESFSENVLTLHEAIALSDLLAFMLGRPR